MKSSSPTVLGLSFAVIIKINFSGFYVFTQSLSSAFASGFTIYLFCFCSIRWLSWFFYIYALLGPLMYRSVICIELFALVLLLLSLQIVRIFTKELVENVTVEINVLNFSYLGT